MVGDSAKDDVVCGNRCVLGRDCFLRKVHVGACKQARMCVQSSSAETAAADYMADVLQLVQPGSTCAAAKDCLQLLSCEAAALYLHSFLWLLCGRAGTGTSRACQAELALQQSTSYACFKLWVCSTKSVIVCGCIAGLAL